MSLAIKFSKPQYVFRQSKILPYGAIVIVAFAFCLTGCSVTGAKSAQQQAAAIVLTSSVSSVRANGSVVITAAQEGVAVPGGTWAVMGGQANGTIDAGGTYSAPPAVPATNQVAISYTLGSVTSTTMIAILNPIPVVAAVTPNVIVAPTRIVVQGTQFVPGSTITVNTVPVPTTFIDYSHLSAFVIPDQSQPLAAIGVVNPNPGMVTSQSLPVSQVVPSFKVSPTLLHGGSVSINLAGTNLPQNALVLMDGQSMKITSASDTSITATGFLLRGRPERYRWQWP